MNVAALSIMERNWRPEGYTSPNPDTYPWQWLWDSCFHALIWQRLGRPDRAITELESVFTDQGTSGFVPHMRYVGQPDFATDFWRRRFTSSITQPPMYGHAVAELVRAGVDVGSLVDRAALGIRHLADRPRTQRGLIPIFHPWESGCDDSLRWDQRDGRFDSVQWRVDKGRFVEALEFDRSGAPVANPLFSVGSISFNALVAFNAAELVSVGVDGLGEVVDHLDAVVAGLRDEANGTWIDDSGRGGAAARTLDAHLPLLRAGSDEREGAFSDLTDAAVFGAQYGPAGVARDQTGRVDDQYWRGPAWPQLSYLLWIACTRAERPEAGSIAASLVSGAQRSGFAEYWNPHTGAGLGARPQSWACLATLVV